MKKRNVRLMIWILMPYLILGMSTLSGIILSAYKYQLWIRYSTTPLYIALVLEALLWIIIGLLVGWMIKNTKNFQEIRAFKGVLIVHLCVLVGLYISEFFGLVLLASIKGFNEMVMMLMGMILYLLIRSFKKNPERSE